MIEIETANYIKGLHNLLNAHFTLRNYTGFNKTLNLMEGFRDSDIVKQNNNNQVQVFVYLYIAKINQHFLEGTFKEGLAIVPDINQQLKEFNIYLDHHRVLVFYYKIASLYFGAGDYDTTIDYLNKIINWKVDLRNDLQCYARLLHLISHYEIGNFQLLEYLIKSVYRFMAKMQNLSLVEEEMFKFLRKSFYLSARKLQPEFEKLLDTIRQFEKSKFETRAFAYLDIISWLESKVYSKPVYEIIREKYLSGKRVTQH
jgi:tetratricopeptide (TPR) repeat protein